MKNSTVIKLISLFGIFAVIFYFLHVIIVVSLVLFGIGFIRATNHRLLGIVVVFKIFTTELRGVLRRFRVLLPSVLQL